MLGRSSDSYIDENGNTIYLFDTEYSLSIDDPIIEWEVSAFKTNKKYVKVAQVVLKNEYIGREHEVINYLCKKYSLDGIKIYDSFSISEVTGKRDYKLLKEDRNGYYSSYNENSLMVTDYPENEEPVSNIITIEQLKSNNKKLVKAIK